MKKCKINYLVRGKAAFPPPLLSFFRIGNHREKCRVDDEDDTRERMRERESEGGKENGRCLDVNV